MDTWELETRDATKFIILPETRLYKVKKDLSDIHKTSLQMVKKDLSDTQNFENRLLPEKSLVGYVRPS